MRYSSRHKAETRRRIVAEAARQFRERGLDAVSVADVMAGAGLTHGGFYAHFASKEELIAEALGSPEGAMVHRLRLHAQQAPPGRELESMVRQYLSPAHRARRAQGCVIAALGTEAGRHTPQARRALAQRGRTLVQTLRDYLPARPGVAPEALATPAAACLVGGMILSRLEEDPEAAGRILEQCQEFVLNALGVAHGVAADRLAPGPGAAAAGARARKRNPRR